MKITIKNFGPIDHFEFDLEKDLHVIYGENNIGKSWAISVAYLLLKQSSEITNLNSEQLSKLKEYNKKKELNKKGVIIPLKEDVNFFTNLNTSLENSFGEMKNIISDLEPEILIETKLLNITLTRYVGEEVYDNSVAVAYIPQHFGATYNLSKYVFEEKEKSIINDTFENIYFLPASKSGIYQIMSNLGNIFARLSQFSHKSRSLDLPSMSEPISDYILNIAAINSSKQGEFGNFVNFLEEKIIEGSVVFDELQKKLKYKSNRTGLVSELHEASSMIAEISPLVAYLKYILQKKNSILFIEEPEAHLHPKVQVEMMKVFVELAKSGVKVVMTTHSDFMMNELSNTLLAKEIDAEKVASYHLKMGEKGSFDAGDMKATSEGIEDYNFTDVAVEQYERRIEILEKLNQDAVRQN